LWSSNAAGIVNFQTPEAVHNFVFMLEVLMAAGASNAAALGIFFELCSAACSNIVNSVLNLSAELGINFDSWGHEDTELHKIYVPKFIVPAGRDFLDHCRGLGLNGTMEIFGWIRFACDMPVV
jgi:hypothetical protein